MSISYNYYRKKLLRNLIFMSACFLLCCCKTNRIVDGERQGLWIEKQRLGELQLKSKGRYTNGFQHKTWRYYENGKLIKREKYKDSICAITLFENRYKIREGKAKLRISDTLLHWFYFGEWKSFDASGAITEIDYYEDGKLISTNEVLQ